MKGVGGGAREQKKGNSEGRRREIKGERQRERQRDRETKRETKRVIERETETETHREREMSKEGEARCDGERGVSGCKQPTPPPGRPLKGQADKQKASPCVMSGCEKEGRMLESVTDI